MRERLVVCGVHICLTTDILKKALIRVNRGGTLMEQHNDGPTSFYHPALYGHESGAPLDQRVELSGRLNRLPISPARDYLRYGISP